MLQRHGRVSYRALKRQFDLDNELLEDLRFELVEVQKVAEVDDEIFTYIGDSSAGHSGEGIASKAMDSGSRKARVTTAERRQLTVMFIDLVGSTKLSRSIDPEDLREILYDYQDLFDRVVSKHQGLVVQHLGDGIMAYFGYPTAHEDDPHRAILSGLAMFKALKKLNQKLQDQKNLSLKVRIGVHTGLVVIGSTGGKGHSEILALGEAPNLAAHIQGVAQPDTLVISDATSKLVQGHFELTSLGPISLKGFADQVELYQVLGEQEKSFVESLPGDHLNPIVGREAERDQILDRWVQAKEGRGQVVLIGGEAGIGKSRLVRTMVGELTSEVQNLLSFRCSPYHRNTTYQPIIERLIYEMNAGIPAGKELTLENVRRYLDSKGLREEHDLEMCALLLSISMNDHELLMSAERKKVLTLDMLVRWLLDYDKRSLILIEDLHWADPSTLELLRRVMEAIVEFPAFLIATYRPEFQHEWSGASHILTLVVNRLTRNQASEMIRHLAGNLPNDVLEDLLTKTDGNPLFVEEVTKLVLDSGVLQKSDKGYVVKVSLKSISIPNTLQDSLMARLDRLGEVKEVAQIGATIGREFSYSLLAAISKMPEDLLRDYLKKLVEAEMLFKKGSDPDPVYTFKHALIQEAAYESLLKKSRQEFHRRIVDVLEGDDGGVSHSNPELIAQHCTGAGLHERSLPYWRRAGELAVSRSAHAEAISHLNEGLAVLHELPKSQAHFQDEILFQIALGVPLTALRGYGSPEVEKAYARARSLCNEVGETWQLVPALYGLWRYYLLRAEYNEARALSDQILSLSRRSEDPVHLVVANRASGSTRFYLGELNTARSHLEEIISSNTSPDRRGGTLLYDVVDAWVTARSYISWTLWLQGYPDQAMQQSTVAVEIANELNHPFSKALCHSFAAWLRQFRGETKEIKQCTRLGLAIAQENGFQFWVGWGHILEGWAGDAENEPNQLDYIKAGLENWHTTGSELGTSYFLYLLAERLLAHRELSDAWECLDKAKVFIDRTGERWWEAELLRLEGLLHLAADVPNQAEAEKLFRKAIEIAQKQTARALELRAATDLADLLARTGRPREGFQILNEIVSWFREGLSLSDMVEARDLLLSISSDSEMELR